MLFGSNAKTVLKILSDFLDFEENIAPGKTPDVKGQKGFVYVWTLRIIAEDFLAPADFNKDKLFDLICADYNSRNGIGRFISYKTALEQEKANGFKNLKKITETVRRKLKKV